MTAAPRVVIVVTHLLGTGHLARALALARALQAAGAEATIVSGGRPAAHLAGDGVPMIQLPPVASDGVDFRRLLGADGAPMTEAGFAERRARLRAVIADGAPDALITELWPFGRRALSDEFGAALDALPKNAAVLCSIRDILAAPSKPERIAETAARVAARYDRVLVHGDPALAPLEASWPGGGVAPPAAVAERVAYTGYLTGPPPPEDAGSAGRGEVVVAVGGGPVGGRLLRAAAQAAGADGRTWRLLVGGGAERITAIRDAATRPERCVVEPPRPDYRLLLSRAACSVSLVGYNTALDLLDAAVPAVLIPFEDGGETEQRLRAEALAARAGAVVVSEADATPARLLEAVAAAIDAGPLRLDGLRRDGAAESARLTLETVARKRSG